MPTALLADVVFPLQLRPMTYVVPAGMSIKPGMLVEAVLRKSLKRGVVFRLHNGQPPKGARDISGIVERPLLPEPYLELVQWAAEYYMSTEGMALKCALPDEYFTPSKPRALSAKDLPQALRCPPGEGYGLTEAEQEGIAAITKARSYEAYLYYASTRMRALRFIKEILKHTPRALVLAPDQSTLEPLATFLETHCVLYHGALSKGARSQAIAQMQSGAGPLLVLGSRAACFAPMSEPSLIVVMDEECRLYKDEGGIRYNARDVAVMRAYKQGIPVLLTTLAPSVESYHNALAGKYRLIEGRFDGPNARPKVRVLDRRAKPTAVLATLKQAIERHIAKDEKVAIFINRAGYAMLRCEDCDHEWRCHKCGTALQWSKSQGVLSCAQCAGQVRVPKACPSCRGVKLVPVGAGMERVEQELAALTPVQVRGGKAGQRDLMQVLDQDSQGLVLGTSAMFHAGWMSGGEFGLAASINADAYLAAPDFRARERALQDSMRLVSMVGAGGEVFFQTRQPKSLFFDAIRSGNVRSVYLDELREREALGYPPFRKLATVSVQGGETPPAVLGIAGGAEVMGPAPYVAKGGRPGWKYLCKAQNAQQLRAAVQAVLSALGERKATVDVDPVVIL